MTQTAGYITLEERTRLVRQISRFLASARTFWVFCHENPDGDTLGCGLAAYTALEAAGKDVQLFTPNTLPRMYTFLPHADQWRLVDELPEQLPQVVLVLDNAAWDRIGRNYAQQLTARGVGPNAQTKTPGTVVINIDHHFGNTMYGDYNLVDPGCCACGELLYYAFQQLELPLTLDVSVCLYAAILTDTGRFSYANTNFNTFKVASELIELGVDPFDVVNRVYNKRTPQQIMLLGRVLGTLEAYPDEGFFTCFVTQSMLDGTGCDIADTEGAVDVMKTVAGYECCFMLKEETDGPVKVSARAVSDFDVRLFALRFGGGGHTAAAGFRVPGPLPAAIDRIREELRVHRAAVKRASQLLSK